ncbi:TPA: hypothetical protein EYP66_14025 [Candidatus Poribacteria bacterium]|nr:hypothetical protein [Candidatus Poribacteria bacterium]
MPLDNKFIFVAGNQPRCEIIVYAGDDKIAHAANLLLNSTASTHIFIPDDLGKQGFVIYKTSAGNGRLLLTGNTSHEYRSIATNIGGPAVGERVGK